MTIERIHETSTTHLAARRGRDSDHDPTDCRSGFSCEPAGCSRADQAGGGAECPPDRCKELEPQAHRRSHRPANRTAQGQRAIVLQRSRATLPRRALHALPLHPTAVAVERKARGLRHVSRASAWTTPCALAPVSPPAAAVRAALARVTRPSLNGGNRPPDWRETPVRKWAKARMHSDAPVKGHEMTPIPSVCAAAAAYPQFSSLPCSHIPLTQAPGMETGLQRRRARALRSAQLCRRSAATRLSARRSAPTQVPGADPSRHTRTNGPAARAAGTRARPSPLQSLKTTHQLRRTPARHSA